MTGVQSHFIHTNINKLFLFKLSEETFQNVECFKMNGG